MTIMDQKRILWIAAAVGIFLLVVVGAALILYSPSLNAEPVMVSVQQQDSQPVLSPAVTSNSVSNKEETVTTVIQPEGTTALSTTEKVKELTVISENTTIYSDKATYTQEGSSSTDTVVAQNPPHQTQIQIQIQPMAQETVATQTVTANSSVTRAPSTVSASSAVTPVVKETPKKSTTATTSSATTSTTKKTSSTTSTAKKTSVATQQKPKASYWIQAASFTSKKNAEDARTTLSEQKISSEIFTYESKGKTYYRVRIGPYVTKTEAEYWKGRIELVKGFENCYITNTSLPAVKK
ncbi:MAG: hypothetical protein E7062_06140 [Spirochaetaceae bacterium]|nr:hypothetical protein [Spirochaetaceae bacterium]